MANHNVVFGFAADDVIAEKYRVERVLGMGGMGIVIAATHVHLRERVALKILFPDRARNSDCVARFMREARAVVRIRSEHVARVLDVGLLDSGVPFMVMELLEGTSLLSLLQKGGALPIGTTLEYVMQACVAIAEAHALGIVHRDLKPSNLFVTWNADGTPCVKVLDFGISKFADAEEGIITHSAVIVGSPSYMAPEQLESAHEVDARADIWSLGVLLYELVTGVRPFVAGSIVGVCSKIANDSPIPPRQIRPDLPKGVEDAILRCLERDLDKRFPHVGALVAALAPYAPPSARRSLVSFQDSSASHRIAVPKNDSLSRRKAVIVATLSLFAAGCTLVAARAASPDSALIAEKIAFPTTFGSAMRASVFSASDVVSPLVPRADADPNVAPRRDPQPSRSRASSRSQGRRATSRSKSELFADRKW